MEVSDLIDGVRASRRYFFKHLDGLADNFFGAKPHPECKSARETLVHLIAVDRGVLESLRTASFPDFFAIIRRVEEETARRSRPALESALAAGHEELLGYLGTTYGNSPLDATMTLWGEPKPLATAIPYLSSEDYYHAGQLGYLRLAADPTWDYYAAVYG